MARYRLGVLDGRSWHRGARRVVGGLSIAVAVLVAAACSASSSGESAAPGGVSTNASQIRATCTLMERLPHAADALTDVPLSDPVRFDTALRLAVAEYTRTLDDIALRVPASLRRQVEVLRSAVQQHKFADAQAARAPLDDWAATHCS